MTRTSWLRKIWKGRSKGVSTVIGTVFLMLIIFMVSTNVLLWTFSQNALYTQAEKDVNQDEADRRNENVDATDVDYIVSGNEVTVKATLTNTGSVAVQIVNLWVFDNTNQTYGFNNTIESLNLNLNPGNIRTVSVVVTVPEADQNHKFNSFFVTARGNVVGLEVIEETVRIANVTQGIGSIAMDFESFRYFEYETDPPNKLKNSGNVSFTIPHNKPIAFGVFLTNFDPSRQTITFDNYSQLWLYCPEAIGATQAEPPVWYIVNVDENGIIQDSYSEISINYTDAKLIIFASKTAGSFSKVQLTKTDYKNKLFAANLMLHGKLEDRDYGQNIPFVSLYCQG